MNANRITDFLTPNFHKRSRVHDWKNYVGDNTIVIWNTFTEEQKLAIALDAQDMADNEEWD